MKVGNVLATVVAALAVVGIAQSSALAALGDVTDTLEVSIIQEATDAFLADRVSGTAAVGDGTVGDTILVTIKTRSKGNAIAGCDTFVVGSDTLTVTIEKKAGYYFDPQANSTTKGETKFKVKENVTDGTTFKMYYVVNADDSCDVTGFRVKVMKKAEGAKVWTDDLTSPVSTSLNIDGIKPTITEVATGDTIVFIGNKVGDDSTRTKDGDADTLWAGIGDTLKFSLGKASESNTSLTVGIAKDSAVASSVVSLKGSFSTKASTDAVSATYVVTEGDTTMVDTVLWAFLKDAAGNIGGTYTSWHDTLWLELDKVVIAIDGEAPKVSGRVLACAPDDSTRFLTYNVTNDTLLWFEQLTDEGYDISRRADTLFVRATPSDTTYLGHTITGSSVVTDTIAVTPGTKVEAKFKTLRDSVAYNIAYKLKDWFGNETAWDSLANVRYDTSSPLLSV